MTTLKTLLAEDRDLARSHAANEPKRRLALALRALRKGARLTQSQVAERAGLTQSHVSKMESATGPMPTNESLARYAEACEAQLCLAFPRRGAKPEAANGGPLVCAMF